ncbi:MAG TPA: hypothetical protein PLN18_02950 [Candidatus Colwellbacteria bacterium]|nr:hypothetical protein [Candidatus Colwellbacteria bacterium]
MAVSLTERQELANDIAAATFRVAGLVKEDRLRTELQLAVFDLILSGSTETMAKLKVLIRFGQSIKQIKDINAEVLLRELGHLEDMAVSAETAMSDVNVMADFDSGRYIDTVPLSGQTAKRPSPTLTRAGGRIPAKDSASIGQINADRVLRFIEARPETRLRDLEQAFSDLSERTLRRAIEKLTKSGKIERVGNIGPYGFYRSLSSSRASLPRAAAKPALMKTPENRNSGTIIAL